SLQALPAPADPGRGFPEIQKRHAGLRDPEERCRRQETSRLRTTLMTSKISLTRYLVEKQRVHDRIPADLRLLLEVVARACKSISHAVTKGALGDILGSAGTDNVQGEE